MRHIELSSPRISHLSWGHIEVEGHPPFKDAKAAHGSGTGVTPARGMCLVFSLPTLNDAVGHEHRAESEPQKEHAVIHQPIGRHSPAPVAEWRFYTNVTFWPERVAAPLRSGS